MPPRSRASAKRHGDRTDAPADGRRAWYFERRISLDTIVGILGIAVVLGGPFIIWGRAMESRVLTLETMDAQRSKYEQERAARLEQLSDKMTQVQVAIGQLSATVTAIAATNHLR